jgi:hypothetical protein
MKLISLTKGKFAQVDDEDFEELNQYKWRFAKKYAIRDLPMQFGVRSSLYMHTAITGYPETDHRDGDRLNNQKSNLREVTRSQNRTNSIKPRTGLSTSKYKGVILDRRHWRARVTLNEGMPRNRQKYLPGPFETEETAALAVDSFNRNEWGEHAVYNFPLPGERSALTGQMERNTQS